MNKIKIILIGLLLYTAVGFVGYETILDIAIPKFKPFGNSTTFADSTNYVTLNKGLYVLDSFKVKRDLYVGTAGGKLYLDTNREGLIYFSATDMYIKNTKSINPTMNLIIGKNGLSFAPATFNIMTVDNTLLSLDSTNGMTISYGGLFVSSGNISVSGTTQEYKMALDTVSDYDSDDAVTLNRQASIITTKALSTVADATYTLTFNNSLITSSTGTLFQATINSYTGAGTVHIVYAGYQSAGVGRIILKNIHAATSLNAAVKIGVTVINKP